MKKGFLLLVVLATFVASCQKDKVTSLRTAGIVQGSWRVKARDTVNSLRPDTVGYDTLSASERISRYRFFPNGDLPHISTYLLDRFLVPDSSVTGRWLLQYADTRLVLTDPRLMGDFRFVYYDDTTMKLLLVIPNGETDSTTITTTLLRQ